MTGYREFVSLRKVSIVIFSAIVVLALVFAGLWLCERSEIASVIDDEAVWDLRDSSPRMRIIVLEDGTVARFVAEDETTYTGDVQDTFTVDKEGASVEVWYACDGKGIVYLKDFGRVDAYAEPGGGPCSGTGGGPCSGTGGGPCSVVGSISGNGVGSCSGSGAVGTLVYEEGYVPETYRCLGYRDGWFKVGLTDGVVGYVNEKYIVWDAIDSF